ncbi:hypothetical protein [Herbaspirillum autotrophicum]|uniref:hypothetical protein n=1 Tax=Herbaspirillum autotrophicum TaxID=180195 RepID=UPI0012ED1BF4|nr:hypothetical protein [Herbaspirillum autotrophicum]
MSVLLNRIRNFIQQDARWFVVRILYHPITTKYLRQERRSYFRKKSKLRQLNAANSGLLKIGWHIVIYRFPYRMSDP